MASASDYWKKVGLPGNATTLAAPGHTIGGTSFTVVSTSLWPTDTGVTFAIDTTQLINGVTTRIPGSYTVWDGVVSSGTTITGAVLRYGSDQNYSAGSTTRVYILPTSTRENRIVDGLLISLDQDGTLKAGAVDNTAVLASDVVTTVKILDANVTTSKLANASITPTKLATGAAVAAVATSETTTSTTYADLATTTDTVTVAIGSNGLAQVSIGGHMSNNTGDAVNYISFAVSGGSTVAAGTKEIYVQQQSGPNHQYKFGQTFLLTGLTGSCTFKMKYKVSAGTGTYLSREISVLPL